MAATGKQRLVYHFMASFCGPGLCDVSDGRRVQWKEEKPTSTLRIRCVWFIREAMNRVVRCHCGTIVSNRWPDRHVDVSSACSSLGWPFVVFVLLRCMASYGSAVNDSNVRVKRRQTRRTVVTCRTMLVQTDSTRTEVTYRLKSSGAPRTVQSLK